MPVPRKDYGHPVSRNRLYILLVKCDLMVGAARSDFAGFCAEICNALKHSSDVNWFLCLRLSRHMSWINHDINIWDFIIILELEERSPPGKGSPVGQRCHGKAVPQEEKTVLHQAPWLLIGILLNPLQSESVLAASCDFHPIKASSRQWKQMEIFPQGLGEAKQSQGHIQIASNKNFIHVHLHEAIGFSLSCVRPICQVKSAKGTFQSKHPAGLDQITTPRELQAWYFMQR